MPSSSGFIASIFQRSTARSAARSVTFARMISTLSLGVVASLAAQPTAEAAPSCEQYPIPWRPVDGAQSAAQADLASLSPGANMTWNSNTGTLGTVFPLAIKLPSCSDGQDAIAQVFGVLAAHPALFQLDLSEWRRPEPFDCKYLGDNTTLNMGRSHLAGRPISQDVFAYSLKRTADGVQLSFVNGTYLPVVGEAMGDSMAACSTLTSSVAIATARKAALNAGVFSQCRRTGAISYTPKANDTFSLSEGAWSWQEDAGQVLVTGERTLRVVINPANYTPELISSDARCPVAGGNANEFTIGFDVTFDVNTGAIINVKPGLDCVVC